MFAWQTLKHKPSRSEGEVTDRAVPMVPLQSLLEVELTAL